jgi:two-component system OmpR family response regulator
MARLLVIEDDEAIGFVIAECLRAGGFVTTLVPDLDAATGALGVGAYDQVLTDLLRPQGMPRLDAARHLRQITGDTPTILMTAHAEAQDWDAAQFGFAAILIKPFDLDALLDLISALLPGHQGTRAVA